ncbi:MAG: DUF234 domain-containing protein, partial [Candidatus Margulisbacteria bacterium]|nr:DUF234 domain-containing protein [Candidatus Margulisiibacteriota bacterium]
ISFWFKFVYVYNANLEKGEKNYVLAQIKKSFIPNHAAFVYEDVCKEKMWKLNSRGKLSFRFDRLGGFWNKNTEIDIVAIDSVNKNLILGECKFSNNPKGIEVLNNLRAKGQAILNEIPKGQIVSYVVFSRAGFKKNLLELARKNKNIVLVTG